MRNNLHWLIAVLALTATVPLGACSGKDEADTDTDTDADTDTDTDTDADTDTDTDADYAFATEEPSAYTRVDRMGMPAIATAVISSKDDYNGSDPSDDAAGTFVSEIVASLEFLHGALDDDLASFGLTPCDVDTCVGQAAPLVVPDTLKIDVTVDAGFPNGRALADPVIDVTLAVVLLDLSVHSAGLLASLPLNPPENDVAYSTSFPYLAAPN